jgi:hypothetical protein
MGGGSGERGVRSAECGVRGGEFKGNGAVTFALDIVRLVGKLPKTRKGVGKGEWGMGARSAECGVRSLLALS